MKKNFSSTLIFALVFVGLIAWYQLYEKKYRGEKKETEEKAKQLVQIKSDEIQELIVEKMKNPPADDASPAAANAPAPEYEVIYLKKTGDSWSLVKPLQDTADKTAVTSMLNTFATTKQDRVVEENPKSLETFGLAHPLLKLTAKKDSSDKGVTVFIGRNTPVEYNAYARVDGQTPVYRVPRTLRSAFDKPLKDYRNKEILGLSRADVLEAEIQTPSENYILKRPTPDKEEWTLARDLIPADTTEWNKTLNALVELKATDFASESATNLAQYGLAKPARKISIAQKEGGKKTVLSLGKVGDKVFAKRDDKPIIYEVDKSTIDKVSLTSEKYRSVRLATFNRFDVKRIKFERGSQSFDLLKETAGWTTPATPNEKIDDSKVDKLLSALQDTKIEKYLTSQKAGAKNAELVIRLFEQGDKEKLTLKFSNFDSKHKRAERTGLDIPFLLKSDEFKKLDLQPKDFAKVEEVKPESSEPKKEEKKS